MVTKSGGNRFTGSLFEYKRDDAFDAASKYDDEKQELSLDQFGGSLGGPVVQNRSFFFASFERLRQRTGLRFTEAVPSVEARRRIAAGEPVGSGAGQSGDRTRAVAPLLAGFLRNTTPLESAPRSGDARHTGGPDGEHVWLFAWIIGSTTLSRCAFATRSVMAKSTHPIAR